jgi:phosphopantothenoylcysteine decarboxylase
MAATGRSVVILAVGGGIAAYKSAALCSRLVQAGHEVRVAMTASATQFVGPATFAALSGRAVATGSFESGQWPLGPHIELAGGTGRADADLMIVAPATANLLGQFAHGLANDLVATLYLQVACPVLLAPAMSQAMWSKPAVERNIEQLRRDGCHFIGPEQGWLSCRQTGSGRMSEPDAIAEAAQKLLMGNSGEA